MKKKLIVLFALCVVIVALFFLTKESKLSQVNIQFEDELQKSFSWAYKNQITSKKTMEEANLDWKITRVEMAKMMSNFSKTILHHMPDMTKQCQFDDVEEIEPVLKLSVIQACQFWLMGQNTNRFRPMDSVTRAEFWVILSRALFWERYQWWEPYYQKSLQVLNKLWIVKDISDPSLEEKRWRVIMMLKRSEDFSRLKIKDIERLIDKDHYVNDIELNNWETIPVLGFETMGMSNEMAEKLVYEAIKVGYRLFDTAKYYSNEEGVWRGIKRAMDENLVTREEIFIVAKILPSSYYDIDAAIDESLDNLMVDYIDLFLVQQPWEGDEKLYQALEKWVEEWKIHSIWISNYYSKEDFDRIYKIAKIKPSVVQNENHIFYQNTSLKEYIRKYWVVLQSSHPFWWDIEQSFSNEIISKLSEKFRKSSAQVVLRWQVQDWNVVIPWMLNIEELKQYYDIFDFELSDQEMKLIKMINENKRGEI